MYSLILATYLQIGNKGICSNNVKCGDTKNLVGVVYSSFFVDFRGNGYSWIDRVWNNCYYCIRAYFRSCLSQIGYNTWKKIVSNKFCQLFARNVKKILRFWRIKKIAFCFQNDSDLLWEKIVLIHLNSERSVQLLKQNAF